MNTQPKTYTAHGKFLITGEYAVLSNVPALAVPLQLNQYLKIYPRNDNKFSWHSYDHDGSLWFNTEHDLNIITGNQPIVCDNPIANKLIEILITAHKLSPYGFNTFGQGFDAVTTLDFNRIYGMGTSSTLLSLLSQWLECDAYALQFACFGGSGYDIACATASKPLIYNYNNAQPQLKSLDWSPMIKDAIFFVYLNNKQDSRDAIACYDPTRLTSNIFNELSDMPQLFINASDHLGRFNQLIQRHEAIISSIINLQPVQARLFNDYTGAIKSLGGWGGDFIMCTGGNDHRQYFIDRGYNTILEWDQVIR